MAPSPDPILRGNGPISRTTRALGEATSSLRPEPEADLLGQIAELEAQLHERSRELEPSPQISDALERLLKMQLSELTWRSRMKRGRESILLLGALIWTLVGAGVAWERFLG